MIIKRQALEAALTTLAKPGAGASESYAERVLIDPDRAVTATDGHMAYVIRDTEPFPDTDFPLVAGAPFDHDPTKPMTLDADVIKALLTTAPKAGKTKIPILAAVQIGQNGNPKEATVAATDLKMPRVATVTTEYGDYFPNVRRVYESVTTTTDKAKVSVCLSVELLEHLCAAARVIGSKKKGVDAAPRVVFTLPVPEHGAVLTGIRAEVEGQDGLTLDTVIVPTRR